MTESHVTGAVDIQKQLEEAINDVAIPEVHFNGFTNGLGQGDILIVLTQHGRTVLKLSTNYSVAKTLAQKLAEALVSLERRTGQGIMTIEEINKAFQGEETGEEAH